MPLSKITNPFLATPNTRISSNAANTINVSLGASNPSIYISGYYIDAANNFGRVGINNSNPTRGLDIGGANSAEMNFTHGGTVQTNGKVWNIVVDSGGPTSNANFTIRRLTDDGSAEVPGGGFGFGINGTTGIFSTNANRKISPASVPAGSVIQVVQHDMSSIGLFSSSGNAAELAVTNSSRTFTPLYNNSKVLHILTIGFKAICDGRIYIRRGSTNSPSIGDQWREMSWDATVDMGPMTMQYLDSPATTSEITYSLRVAATGCGSVLAIGNSGDFTPYWTMMEIAV